MKKIKKRNSYYFYENNQIKKLRTLYEKEQQKIQTLENDKLLKFNIDKVLESKLSNAAIDIGKMYLSESFLKISYNTNLYGYENVYDTPFINDLVNYIKTVNDSSVKDFYENIASIVVYLKLSYAKFFRNNVEKNYYLPETLASLTMDEKLPEVFNKNLDEDTKNFIVNKINLETQLIVKELGNFLLMKINPKAHKYQLENNLNFIYESKKDTEVKLEDYKYIKNILNLKKDCVNSEESEKFNSTVYYSENNKNYCIDLDDLILKIKNGENLINPTTRKQLDANFVDEIKEKYKMVFLTGKEKLINGEPFMSDYNKYNVYSPKRKNLDISQDFIIPDMWNIFSKKVDKLTENKEDGKDEEEDEEEDDVYFFKGKAMTYHQRKNFEGHNLEHINLIRKPGMKKATLESAGIIYRIDDLVKPKVDEHKFHKYQVFEEQKEIEKVKEPIKQKEIEKVKEPTKQKEIEKVKEPTKQKNKKTEKKSSESSESEDEYSMETEDDEPSETEKTRTSETENSQESEEVEESEVKQPKQRKQTEETDIKTPIKSDDEYEDMVFEDEKDDEHSSTRKQRKELKKKDSERPEVNFHFKTVDQCYSCKNEIIEKNDMVKTIVYKNKIPTVVNFCNIVCMQNEKN